jgi:hypothetical protein
MKVVLHRRCDGNRRQRFDVGVIVSVLGNRPKVLPRLGGEGVAVLEARLSRPTRTGG